MFTPEPSIGFGGGMNFMFTLVPIIVVIGFIVVFSLMIMNGVRYARNARSPRESVYARIAAKRTEVSGSTHHHHHANGSIHPTRSTRTHYYITLEFENGQRREYLDVKNLYGLVVEGDVGYAAVQGDWLVAFERQTV